MIDGITVLDTDVWYVSLRGAIIIGVIVALVVFFICAFKTQDENYCWFFQL